MITGSVYERFSKADAAKDQKIEEFCGFLNEG